MNPKIDKIISEMEAQCPKDNELQTPHNKENYLSVKMAQLLGLLARETETQSQILVEQTKQLIRFTRWLLVFTIIVAVLTFVLILQAFEVLPERKPQLHQGNYDANQSYFYACQEIEAERFVTIKINDIV